MIPSTDIHNHLVQLLTELRAVSYPVGTLDHRGLCSGVPRVYLGVLQHVFSQPGVAAFLLERGHDLRAKRDEKLLALAYKVLGTVYNYHPQLTVEQFSKPGFAARKLAFMTDVLRLTRQPREKPNAVETLERSLEATNATLALLRERVERLEAMLEQLETKRIEPIKVRIERQLAQSRRELLDNLH